MVRIGHTVLGEKCTKICVPIVGTTMKEILDATAVACNTPCHVVEHVIHRVMSWSYALTIMSGPTPLTLSLNY